MKPETKERIGFIFRVIAGIMTIVMMIATTIFCLGGCDLLTEAERVNYNISQQADNFNTYRRVTVIDCITGDTLFVIEGWISINADREDNQLEIIAEDGKNSYKKHFIGLSDNVSYTVEDLSGNNVDRYHLTINYNPKMWIPFSFDNID